MTSPDNAAQPVLYEQDGHIALITLNRPESLNAINPPLRDGLDVAMERARDERTVRVVILTGAGRAFCAGADLKWRAQNAGTLRQTNTQRNRPRFVMPGFDLWKPVIGAVHGYALGGGFEIAMACDVIVAADDAKFGLPEPRRGLAADGGAIHQVVRQLPRKLAMELILTGRMVTAEEARSFGIVNRVVPPEKLMQETRALAAEILECSPQALKASKQIALLGADRPFAKVFAQEFPEFVKLRESNDFVEGPQAFAEKRRPQWEDA